MGLRRCHWVGDLALECALDVQTDAGRGRLRAGQRRPRDSSAASTWPRARPRCPFGRDPTVQPTATTPASRQRSRATTRSVFANCDDQLRLWVDGSVVEFDGADRPTRPLDNCQPTAGRPGAGGHRLARRGRRRKSAISRSSATSTTSPTGRSRQRLRLIRTRPDRRLRPEAPRSGDRDSADRQLVDTTSSRMRIVEFTLESRPVLRAGRQQPAKQGQPALGPTEYWVDRELLIGKALFIYWPHSWDAVPSARNDPLPVLPQFRADGVGAIAVRTGCQNP